MGDPSRSFGMTGGKSWRHPTINVILSTAKDLFNFGIQVSSRELLPRVKRFFASLRMTRGERIAVRPTYNVILNAAKDPL